MNFLKDKKITIDLNSIQILSIEIKDPEDQILKLFNDRREKLRDYMTGLLILVAFAQEIKGWNCRLDVEDVGFFLIRDFYDLEAMFLGVVLSEMGFLWE